MLEWEEILPIRSPLWGCVCKPAIISSVSFLGFTCVQVASYRLVSTFAILVSENRIFSQKHVKLLLF